MGKTWETQRIRKPIFLLIDVAKRTFSGWVNDNVSRLVAASAFYTDILALGAGAPHSIGGGQSLHTSTFLLEGLSQNPLEDVERTCIAKALNLVLRMDSMLQGLLPYSRLALTPISYEMTDCNNCLAPWEPASVSRHAGK